MKLSTLRHMIQVREADILTYQQGGSRRKCHRISSFEALWLGVNGSHYTARQISEHLGHSANTIRAYARRNNIQLKHVGKCYE